MSTYVCSAGAPCIRGVRGHLNSWGFALCGIRHLRFGSNRFRMVFYSYSHPFPPGVTVPSHVRVEWRSCRVQTPAQLRPLLYNVPLKTQETKNQTCQQRALQSFSTDPRLHPPTVLPSAAKTSSCSAKLFFPKNDGAAAEIHRKKQNTHPIL